MGLGRGIFDTDSEPGSWADAIGRHPWIADERDGTLFRNLPAARFKCPLNAVEGGEQPMPAFAPVAVPAPFHADPTTQADGEHHA